MEITLGEKLGEGGFGRVYAVRGDPNSCVKISNKNNSCRAWRNEYLKIMDIHSKLENNEIFKRMKYVRIIRPTKFIEVKSGGDCYMLMNRIYRPLIDKSSPLLKSPSPYINSQLSFNSVSSTKDSVSSISSLSFSNKYEGNGKTLHSLFGMKKSTYKKSERGEFIGINILQIIFTPDQMKTVAYELGKMMALLHFVAKNDAFDIELYIGVEYKTRKVRIYISDFDLSEKITQYTDDIIEDRMEWSLSAMPYFPTYDSNKHLYESFKKGYSKTANDDAIVEKLFSIYT